MYNKLMFRMKQMGATIALTARQMLASGPAQLAWTHLARLVQFGVFVLLWRGFYKAGADLGGMTVEALLTYTLLSFAVRQQLDIITPATSSLWEGSVVGRYTRPMPVYLSYMAETIGRWWLPGWLLFSLPVMLVSPLLGINPLPASWQRGLLFLLSLALSAAIGFAFDLLFSALAIRLKNAVWAATHIREAIFNLLSGALIPFALMPEPVARVLGLLPFGSIAAAPLTIYVGTGDPAPLLALQAVWAAVLWPLAHWCYKKGEERMVSYGG